MTEPLIDHYYSFMAETWDEGIPLGMLRKADGSIIMVALALEPEQAYEVVLAMVVREEATEAVFALDRFTKEGQGTKYDDVLAGHYFDRSLGKSPWVPFIIEYRKEPKHFEPLDYDNEFWNDTLRKELMGSMRNMVRKMVSSL
jgi:hypothetical protein